jgi:formiminoglutamase
MSSRTPHTVDAEDGLLAGASESKLASRFVAWTGARADAVLIGVPFSSGSNAASSTGAAEGPTAARLRLRDFEINQSVRRGIDALRLGDTGDLDVVPGDLDATSARLSEAIASILSAGAAPIVLGGTRDVSFGCIRALVESSNDAGGIHVAARSGAEPEPAPDPHAQPLYRRIVEKLDVVGSHFVEFALQADLNSDNARAWLRDRNVRSVPLAAVRRLGAGRALRSELEYLTDRSGALFVSIELDSFAAAYAPGVSHPSPEGLVPEEGRNLAFLAGRHPRVRLFEVLGLNPRCDVEGRTAELAAALISSFVSGLADRKMNRP